jgi:hypothetical protein
MINRKFHFALLALFALLAPTSHAAAADKLRISYSAINATQAVLWVAQDRGIFAKHGLEGALLYINSGTKNIATLLDGSVQIAGSERIIGRYMKINDPNLIATEFDFVSSLIPDYMAPTFDGIKVILENFGKEYPDAPKRDPKEFADGSIIERLKQEKFAEGLKF